MSEKQKRGLTILSALTGAIVTAIGVVLTPDVVMWIAVFLLVGLASLFISWGATQTYKRRIASNWHYDEGRDTYRPALTVQERVKVWDFAVGSALVANMLGGSVLLFWVFGLPFEGVLLTVYLIGAFCAWLLYSILVGFSSPALWRWTFDHLLPKINQKVDNL